ncbi:sensor histidine kinase [Mariprofundus ferrinatatus]|nr:ATP-binding protein [Mariprofundus ferrinatatus]
MATLLVTAGLSSWLGEKWRSESIIIESRVSQLTSLGKVAVEIYELEGREGYRQWFRQNMRSKNAYGRLLESDGALLGGFGQGRHVRPLPEHLSELLDQAKAEGSQITLIRPPMLAVALPLSGQQGSYFWVASTLLSDDEMRESGGTMRLLQLLVALLTIAAVSTILTRMLTRPIKSLQHTTERLGEGELDRRVESAVTGRTDELGELGRSINSTTDQLVQLLASHKQLLRDISHELRSPLARLQVALQLARNSASESTNEELDRIEKEAELLNELIGEVLTLARIEQGGVEIQRQPLNLNEIVNAVVADAVFEAEAEDKSILFTEQAPGRITGDRLWITRALDNVIRNAIRHTPAGNGVEVSLVTSGDNAVIEIRDHGDGVDESILLKLFEPFVRGSEARERHQRASGYGLGLAIARNAIELHGGTITAANHVDGGLCVTITLPKL